MAFEKQKSLKFKNGDGVIIAWNNNTYQGIVDRKMTKNWGVIITSEHWPHKIQFAAVPEEYIKLSNHVDKTEDRYTA